MNLILSAEKAVELESFPFENRYAGLGSLCFEVGDLSSSLHRNKHFSCFYEIDFLLMLVRNDIGINKAV